MTKRTPTIYDERYQNLISTLVERRKALKISQEELSEQLGISRQNISKIENCVRRLDIIELQDWLKALGSSHNILRIRP